MSVEDGWWSRDLLDGASLQTDEAVGTEICRETADIVQRVEDERCKVQRFLVRVVEPHPR